MQQLHAVCPWHVSANEACMTLLMGKGVLVQAGAVLQEWRQSVLGTRSQEVVALCSCILLESCSLCWSCIQVQMRGGRACCNLHSLTGIANVSLKIDGARIYIKPAGMWC